MKKSVLLLVLFFLTLACSDDEDVIVNQFQTDFLKYTVTHKNNPIHKVYTQEYTFEGNKVISENYTNFLFPEHSSFNAFYYDNNNRVVREMRNGNLYQRVEWNNNIASVYDSENNLKGEFKFTNSRLEYYLLRYEFNDNRYRKINYNNNGNVKSIEDENKILVEFLNYDTSVFNPLNLINSITILRIDYKPHFTNLFRVEKVHPYQGDDYSQSLQFYNYEWVLNSVHLVESIEDERSAIYTSIFEYQ